MRSLKAVGLAALLAATASFGCGTSDDPLTQSEGDVSGGERDPGNSEPPPSCEEVVAQVCDALGADEATCDAMIEQACQPPRGDDPPPPPPGGERPPTGDCPGGGERPPTTPDPGDPRDPPPTPAPGDPRDPPPTPAPGDCMGLALEVCAQIGADEALCAEVIERLCGDPGQGGERPPVPPGSGGERPPVPPGSGGERPPVPPGQGGERPPVHP